MKSINIIIKHFKLSFRIFKANKILTLLLISEIIICFCLMNFALNRVDDFDKHLKSIDNAQVKDSIFFMGRGQNQVVSENKVSFEKEDISYKKDMQQYLNTIPEYEGNTEITYFKINNDNSDSYIDALMYDQVTAQKFKYKSINGKWFTDTVLSNGRIPCVGYNANKFNNKFKIGDVISGKITVVNHAVGYEKNYDFNIEFEVVGTVTQKNEMVINTGGIMVFGGTPDLSIYFDAMASKENFLICSQIENVKSSGNMFGTIYLKSGTPNQRITEIKENVAKFGECTEVFKMYEKTEEIKIDKLKMDIPSFIAFFTISFMGLISLTLLNSKNQFKTFSIYNLCGSNNNQCLKIYFTYFFSIILISFLIFALIMIINYFSSPLQIDYLYKLSAKNISIILIISLFLSAISTVIPYVGIKNSSKIENYKN
ncbi:MAG: hypothetical protein RR549_01865 [Oscillospiraceae bacterium]